ncbi:hypothetical protein Syun_000754 [Stephania yunnanensis]|uniref:Uncharacterized protein n=1 Tax=Stephania yunnanensis TaxID=152371 RepID=A0AAP0LGJ4_9MAGN
MAIHTSQTTSFEPSSSKSTESDQGEEREQQSDENDSEYDDESSETDKEDGKEGSRSEHEDDNEGSESRGKDEEEGQSEDEEETEKEKVVEEKPNAKGYGKAKSGRLNKMAADDSFKPFSKFGGHVRLCKHKVEFESESRKGRNERLLVIGFEAITGKLIQEGWEDLWHVEHFHRGTVIQPKLHALEIL